jgi:hypothetical protein
MYQDQLTRLPFKKTSLLDPAEIEWSPTPFSEFDEFPTSPAQINTPLFDNRFRRSVSIDSSMSALGGLKRSGDDPSLDEQFFGDDFFKLVQECEPHRLFHFPSLAGSHWEPPATSSPTTSPPESMYSYSEKKSAGLMEFTLSMAPSSFWESPPKKKCKPECLVFSHTRRGKLVVAVESRNRETIPSETPAPAKDLQSVLEKVRNQIFGDDISTEITRIEVSKPFSPIIGGFPISDATSPISDDISSSESDSELEEPPSPTLSWAMHKSLSAPSYSAAEERCCYCSLLCRRLSRRLEHESICGMLKMPFSPYESVAKEVVEDGIKFGSGGPLFAYSPRERPGQHPRNPETNVGKRPTRGRNSRSAPAERRSLRNSSPRATNEDQTRCVCRKSEKSVPGMMVQWYPLNTAYPNNSDNCQFWLHTKCLNVDEKDLPDTWHCPLC